MPKRLTKAEKEWRRAERKYRNGTISMRSWDEARAKYAAATMKAKQKGEAVK